VKRGGQRRGWEGGSSCHLAGPRHLLAGRRLISGNWHEEGLVRRKRLPSGWPQAPPGRQTPDQWELA
jgi:hypothetical protein